MRRNLKEAVRNLWPDGQKPHTRLGNTDKVAKCIEVQKLLEVRVNAAGAWRERVRTLTGEVSQAVSLAVVTSNCEKSAEAIVEEKFL